MSRRSRGCERRQPHDHLFVGLVLIAIGSAALLEKQGYGVLDLLWTHWPLAITVLGLLRLVTARSARQLGSACFLLLLSAWLYACETAYMGLSYQNSWPLLLLALGLGKILVGSFGLLRGRGSSAGRDDQGQA
ncbi:LiaF transmembrane domain-containing protein [Paucibacter soli]|uniref:LiaF transmembrane domain-containing protein n=1 Tax=Paucibacter soli TaxID=3133433 RepID=UPI00309DAF9E